MSYKERSTYRSCDTISKVDLKIMIKKCTDIRIEYKNQSKTENDLLLASSGIFFLSFHFFFFLDFFPTILFEQISMYNK